MTLEEKRINILYDLLLGIEISNPEAAAALRWAIFTLEQVTK